ncbi:amidohydrolase family protein [Herbiconiux ginsengi]|uniref:Imidazolonepropionase n=1 Tax=Herbiconiux ginsengi TaxID=381665 RepID=A0A1H3RXG8_9MICO|nr:amidohydrolase family protein [Herbiconiux ginsengi]SDZ30362.1 Imidazolonepropionase [Herbiconiux ginsengi]
MDLIDNRGLIDGITLWDGRSERGIVSLRWNGGTIEGLEGAASDRHSGLSVIPGLVDTHVHFDTEIADDGRPQDAAWPIVTPDAEKAMHVAGNALRFAAHGVTTMRDLASSPVQIAVARAFEQGVIAGPRLLAYGPVGMTAGHGDLFTPPALRDRPPVADGVDECRKLVRQWARAGADGIKIYTSGGILSTGDKVGWRNHTRAETEAILDEAHALGLRVAAHAHSTEGFDIALAVGVDSIEHGTGITTEHHGELLRRRLPVAPTVIVHDAILAGTDPRRAAAREKARVTLARRDPAFRAAAEAGVRFVLGTDANGHLVRYGGQLDELRRMRDLFGWTAERTLVSGTSDAADAVGLGDIVGTLAPGYGADFVVVRGRPWRDLDNLTSDRIVAVVARGRLLAGALPRG